MSAVLLVAPDAPRETWLVARRAGIGASEIAAVLGISPWESPFSLFWRKANGWDVEASDEMSTGTFLEATIAAWWATHRNGSDNLNVEHAGLYAHDERPWQMATPDRLLQVVDDCDGDCESGLVPNPDSTFFIDGYEPCQVCGSWKLVALLECKWVVASWDGWGEDGSDVIPVYYRAQCLWQMDVMGVDEVFVAALGPDGFRSFRIRRDETDLRIMREAGARFMARLETGDAPDIDDHSATLATVKRLNSEIDDVDVEIPAAVAAGYERAQRMQRLAKKVAARYAVQVRTHLGTGRRAVCEGRTVASRSVDDKLLPARGAK